MKQLGFLCMLLFLVGAAQAQTKQEIKETKQQERIKKRHSDWPLCFIVRTGGDTIIVNLKPREELSDYCTLGWENGLRVAYGNGEEQKLRPEEFREMYIYNRHSHYIAIKGDGGASYITRVLADGKCKLLYRDAPVSGRTPSGISYASNQDFYYTLYKGNLTRLISGHQTTLVSITLAKNCTEVFAECPSVVEQVNSKKINKEDLADLVNAFNACVEKK